MTCVSLLFGNASHAVLSFSDFEQIRESYRVSLQAAKLRKFSNEARQNHPSNDTWYQASQKYFIESQAFFSVLAKSPRSQIMTDGSLNAKSTLVNCI